MVNEKLRKAMTTLTDKHKITLSIQANSLHHLSPLNTLSRGFSITTNAKNQVLSSTTDIKINQTITTQLADGKLYSNFEKIEEN